MVLTTWASWCQPCLAEFPKLAERASRLPDEDVAGISLSADRADKFETFMAKGELEPPGRVTRLGTQVSFQLRPHGLPTTWVVSRSVEVVIRHAGAADWIATSGVDFVRKMAMADQPVSSHPRLWSLPFLSVDTNRCRLAMKSPRRSRRLGRPEVAEYLRHLATGC